MPPPAACVPVRVAATRACRAAVASGVHPRAAAPEGSQEVRGAGLWVGGVRVGRVQPDLRVCVAAWWLPAERKSVQCRSFRCASRTCPYVAAVCVLDRSLCSKRLAMCRVMTGGGVRRVRVCVCHVRPDCRGHTVRARLQWRARRCGGKRQPRLAAVPKHAFSRHRRSCGTGHGACVSTLHVCPRQAHQRRSRLQW